MRSTEFLFDNYITTFRTQGYFHCVSQFVYTLLQFVTGINVEFNIFSHNSIYNLMIYNVLFNYPKTARTSL